MKITYVIFTITCLTLHCSGEESNNGKTISSSYTYSLEYNDSDHGNFGHKIEVKDGKARVNVRSENPKHSQTTASSPDKHPQKVKYVQHSEAPTVQKSNNYAPQSQSSSAVDAALQKYSKDQLALLLSQNKNPFLPLDAKDAPKKYSAPQTTQPQVKYRTETKPQQNAQVQQVYYQPQAYSQPQVQHTASYSAPQTHNQVQYVYLPQTQPQTTSSHLEQTGPVQFSSQNAHSSEQYLPNYQYNQIQPNTYSTYGNQFQGGSGQLVYSSPKELTYSQVKPTVAPAYQSGQVAYNYLPQDYQVQPSTHGSGQLTYSLPKEYTYSQVQPTQEKSSHSVQPNSQVTYLPQSQYAGSNLGYKSVPQHSDYGQLVQYIPASQEQHVSYKPPESVQHTTQDSSQSNYQQIDFASLFPGFKFEPTSQFLTYPNNQQTYNLPQSNPTAYTQKIVPETNKKLQYQSSDVNAVSYNLQPSNSAAYTQKTVPEPSQKLQYQSSAVSYNLHPSNSAAYTQKTVPEPSQKLQYQSSDVNPVSYNLQPSNPDAYTRMTVPETNKKVQYQAAVSSPQQLYYNFPNLNQVSAVQASDNKYGQYAIDFRQGLGSNGAPQVQVQTNYNLGGPNVHGSAAADNSNVQYVYVPQYVPQSSAKSEH